MVTLLHTSYVFLTYICKNASSHTGLMCFSLAIPNMCLLSAKTEQQHANMVALPKEVQATALMPINATKAKILNDTKTNIAQT
jgi:hypothetical protein